MAEFKIQQVLKGKYSESNQRRNITVVDAPTVMHALYKFVGNRPAIVRPGRAYPTYTEWVATILQTDLKTMPQRDFVASPN